MTYEVGHSQGRDLGPALCQNKLELMEVNEQLAVVATKESQIVTLVSEIATLLT